MRLSHVPQTTAEEEVRFKVRDQRKSGHHWADNEVIDDFGPRIGMNGYAIYMFICRHAGNHDGRCYKSQSDIARAFGSSPDTVQRHLASLVECGLVGIERREGKATVYLVLEVHKRLPQNAVAPTAKCGDLRSSHRPRIAGSLPQVAAHLPQVAVPNKERRLLSRPVQDSGGQPAPPLSPVLVIAREKLMDAIRYSGLRPTDPEYDRRMVTLIRRNRGGLSPAQAKAFLGEDPEWRKWKYWELLDSQEEITFPIAPPKPKPVGRSNQEAARELWGKITERLKPTEPPGPIKPEIGARLLAWDTWIKPTRASGIEGPILYVRVPRAEFKCIGEKFGDAIQMALEELNSQIQDVKFLTAEEDVVGQEKSA